MVETLKAGTRGALIICAIASCLLLAACSTASDPKEAFVGTWNLEGVSMDGTEQSLTDSAAALLADSSIVLNADDTATLTVSGEALNGTWAYVDATHSTITMEGAAQDIVLEDGKLVLSDTSTKMTFKKA